MRRRTISKQHTDVELFPFLSILACTIGTLILLIIVLTTQALNKQEVTTVSYTHLRAHETVVRISYSVFCL